MSPIDGSKHYITPELSMEIQATLGSDIVMAFDYCADPRMDTMRQKGLLSLQQNGLSEVWNI